MPATPHIEKHFTAGESVRDIVIGMSDGLTPPSAGVKSARWSRSPTWRPRRWRSSSAATDWRTPHVLLPHPDVALKLSVVLTLARLLG